MGEKTGLTIEKLPNGGFVVSERPDFRSPHLSNQLFAATDIDDALDFISDELVGPAEKQDMRPDAEQFIGTELVLQGAEWTSDHIDRLIRGETVSCKFTDGVLVPVPPLPTIAEAQWSPEEVEKMRNQRDCGPIVFNTIK